MCLLDCGMTMAGLTKIQKRGVEGNLGHEILQRACLTLEPRVVLTIRLSTGKQTRRWCNMDKLEQIEYQRVSVIDKFQVVHLQAIYHIMRLLPQGEAQGALARKTCHVRAGMVYDGLWHGP